MELVLIDRNICIRMTLKVGSHMLEQALMFQREFERLFHATYPDTRIIWYDHGDTITCIARENVSSLIKQTWDNLSDKH